jgi:hypothetical protein
VVVVVVIWSVGPAVGLVFRLGGIHGLVDLSDRGNAPAGLEEVVGVTIGWWVEEGVLVHGGHLRSSHGRRWHGCRALPLQEAPEGKSCASTSGAQTCDAEHSAECAAHDGTNVVSAAAAITASAPTSTSAS